MLQRLRRLLWRLPKRYVGSGFSVEVQSIGRELVRVIYSREERTLDLTADCYGGTRASICLKVPKDLSAERAAELVRDLSEGFAKVGYGYEIYRAGEPQVIPEKERQQALDELKDMGIEARKEGDRVVSGKLPGFRPPSRQEAAAHAPKLMRLLTTVSGKRVPIEVLASAKPPED